MRKKEKRVVEEKVVGKQDRMGEAVCSSSGNIISFVYASANDYGDWAELYQV